MTTPRTPYQRAHDAGAAALRSAILDVAGELLEMAGPDGISMRNVASRAGCSTMVVYRLFGNKRGLIAGLYREGFSRLGKRLEAAARQTHGPRERLAALADAYRASAHHNRTYYGVMFERPVPEFVPDAVERADAEATFGVLEAAVSDAIAAGVLVPGEAGTIARAMWAAVHGVVSLELAGHLAGEEADEIFRRVTRGVALAFGPEAGSLQEP